MLEIILIGVGVLTLICASLLLIPSVRQKLFMTAMKNDRVREKVADSASARLADNPEALQKAVENLGDTPEIKSAAEQLAQMDEQSRQEMVDAALAGDMQRAMKAAQAAQAKPKNPSQARAQAKKKSKARAARKQAKKNRRR